MRARRVTFRLGVAGCCLVVPFLVGCVEHGAAQSGVRGRTLVDGGCPVERVDSPCPKRPFAAKIVVRRSATDQVLSTTETQPDGQFSISLEPGEYVLHPANLSGAPVPQAADVKVVVETGNYRDLTIVFDSGVRSPGSP